jgi:hypothetical protein
MLLSSNTSLGHGGESAGWGAAATSPEGVDRDEAGIDHHAPDVRASSLATPLGGSTMSRMVVRRV